MSDQLEEAIDILNHYLLRHEDDIANSINDFGDLRVVFEGCIGREPNKDKQ